MKRVSLSLLGGFQARLESGPALEFRTKKARALLAYLVLQPGRVHRRESLASLFWGEMPDERARSSLRHALYELRKAMAAVPAALRIEGDTVTVDASVVDLDVAAFTRLLDAGTPEALERAVALYRGDLLAGLSVKEEPWEVWLRDARERLREQVVEGLAKLLADQRRRGQLKAAIRTAHQLLAHDRLQEAAHRALMCLYVELGQRGAALRQYQECVNVLQRELGVEPEAETRQRYREILQQRTASGAPAAASAAVAASPPRPRKAPETQPAETPLIGREAEMTRLRDALDRAAAGRGGLFAIVGEAGIGKSRLVEELIACAARCDARVLLGRAHESDQILLFGPIVDALRAGQIARDPDVLDALGPVWRAELARLLPEVVAPDAHPLPARVDYRRLFETIAQLVARLAALDPVLIVLEDLHWADELTLRLVAYLARRAPTERVLVVVTAREEELSDASMLRHTLGDLARAGQLVSLALGPLSRRDTVALVALLTPPGAAVRAGQLGDRVWTASEGNPFVAVEMMREIQERGPVEDPTLPRRAREVIGRRLERLVDRSRTLLTVAAVIGREFDFELLRRAGELADDATAEGVEELVRRRLLTGVGERLGFTHERIREVAYSTLPSWRRRRVHRRVADVIETLQADRLPDYWEVLADHCERGEAWARAASYHLRVAERAKQRFAYATAEVSCRQAAGAAAQSPDAGPERTKALELLGDVLSLRGHLDAANESYEAALAGAAGEADPRRIANKLHRRRLASRNGATLAFYEHGTSEETLLLTNPIIYGLEILQPVLEHLSQEFRVITMDLRGTGRSDPIPARYTTGDHAADIGAVIEAAGRGPVTALGISKSGNMLVRLAVTAPRLVSRLVLIGTPLDITPGSMSLVPSEPDDRFREALRAGDLERAMRDFVATVITDPDTGELAEQFTRNLLRLPRESILSTWTPDPEVDIAPILGQVKAPTLVLHGTEDRRVSVAAARHLARHIPDARLHLFEGRGHLPIFTATAEFCEVLRGFVGGGVGGGGDRVGLGPAGGEASALTPQPGRAINLRSRPACPSGGPRRRSGGRPAGS
jgi:DNA-binding SARP family transcriptional activator/pimeloyl-ACP methyl ester carboxylesterase